MSLAPLQWGLKVKSLSIVTGRYHLLLTFALLIQKGREVKLLETYYKSGRSHKLLKVVIVFLTNTNLQKEEPPSVSPRNAFDKTVKLTNVMRHWYRSACILGDEIESTHQSLLHSDGPYCFWGKHCAVLWAERWTSHFLHGTPFLLKGLRSKRGFQTWTFGRHFVWKGVKWAWNFQTRLSTSLASDIIWAFKQKSEFQNTCTYLHELGSLPALKEFSDNRYR